MRKRKLFKLVGGAVAIVLVVAAVAWVIAPARAAPGGRAGTLSATGASAGLARDSVAAAEEPASGGPIVILPDHMDVSPALRDITPIVAPPEDESLRRFNELERLPGHDMGSSSGDSTLQDWNGPTAMPSPSQNWAGMNNTGYTVRPPDTNGDVGPNHYVQWVNLRFQIWNKTGTSLYGPASGNTLWSGFGG